MNGVGGRLINTGGGANVCHVRTDEEVIPPPPDGAKSKRGRFAIGTRRGNLSIDRSPGVLASRSASKLGDEGVDDDPDDGSGTEAEVPDAAYFRLLTTVGVPPV